MHTYKNKSKLFLRKKDEDKNLSDSPVDKVFGMREAAPSPHHTGVVAHA